MNRKTWTAIEMNVPEEAEAHFQSLDLNEIEQFVHEFHGYLREHTSLTPAYRLELKRKAYAVLVNDEDVDGFEGLRDRLLEFKEWREMVQNSTEGDSS